MSTNLTTLPSSFSVWTCCSWTVPDKVGWQVSCDPMYRH